MSGVHILSKHAAHAADVVNSPGFANVQTVIERQGNSDHVHASSTRDRCPVDIPFPIIADLSMEVAQSYGMIQPGASDTSAVRATAVP